MRENSIIAEFIFPCLTATPQEINLIEENPEEFFHQAIDVCDKQVKKIQISEC